MTVCHYLTPKYDDSKIRLVYHINFIYSCIPLRIPLMFWFFKKKRKSNKFNRAS